MKTQNTFIHFSFSSIPVIEEKMKQPEKVVKFQAKIDLTSLLSISIALILTLLLLGCSNDRKRNAEKSSEQTDTTVIEPDIEVNIKSLTEEQAKQKVQYFISRTNQEVTVQVHYWETETKKEPCTQYDIDSGQICTGQTVGAPAPYGYKTVFEQVRKCCRAKQLYIASINGTWRTVYSGSDDKWSVELEFDVEDAKKVLNWIVDDRSGEVTANE